MTDLSPTTEKEREEWSGTDWCPDEEPCYDEPGKPVWRDNITLCANEVIDRLLADVKRLETEVKQLEVKGCPQCPHCHPDSRWP